MKKIHYAKPSITQTEIDFAADAASQGWGEHCYTYIVRFEEMFKEHLGVSHTLATSSCTGAEHLGLAALGLRPGDEVIMAELNWIATAAPIVHLGAKPVLVDVLPDSWCLDPARVREAVTDKTKAIMATHLYGNLCDLDSLQAIADQHGLALIEDAAEALGSVYHGRRAGSLGRFGAFSFHGTKTVTTGEGGLLATNDPELFEKALTLSNHGRKRGETRQFWAETIGYKFKMANVQAAIGCAQMSRFDELIAQKRRIFKWYQEKLKGLPLALNPEPEGCRNGLWMTTAVIDEGIDFNRDRLFEIFKENLIDGRVFFWPLSMMRPDDFIKAGENPVAYGLYGRGVNLPSYHDLTEEEVERVVKCLKQALN